MSDAVEAQPVTAARRSRTVLVTFLGAIVREMGNWMPTTGTIELLARLGVDASNVRTAVFRLRKRGWLVAENRQGHRGYALTAGALEALAEGDEVIWHAREPADLRDGWCVINFSIPEQARARRHQLRAHLTALGFGNIGSAVWIAPARMVPAAQRAVAELDLTASCMIFAGAYVDGPDLASVVRDGWDLDEIDRRYRAFIERYEGEAARLEAAGQVDEVEAFVTYLAVIDHWRKLPFRDPGLPREVLGDGWAGPDAVALFSRLVTMIEGRALSYAARAWPGSTS
jgi:phenylacetic acid degradation operon negative regulatory protein